MACSPESLRDNRFQLSETSPEAPTDPQGSSRHIELSTTTVVIEIVGGCQVRLVVRSGVPEVAAEDTGPPIDRRRCDWP
jgi:hypothetical protein